MTDALGSFSKKKSSNFYIIAFIACWIIINILQSAFVELHADEAYYWIYSQFLDWGYFDHPPMVALYIKAGDAISHSMWGLRLATVFSTAIAIYILWLTVKEYAENPKVFILLFSCFLLFHVYGFITSPDSPLFLFIILFYYLYKKYSERDSWTIAILLSIVIALMLYSKYHGVLLLFFTILSNFKLLTRKSFWAIVIVSVVLFIPHILWQIENDYPSLKFHLFDRSAKPYKISHTTNYILSQTLIAGPIVLYVLYKTSFSLKFKKLDLLVRAAKFNFIGIFLFFLVNSINNDVEPHWTLIAYPPIFILCYIYFTQLPSIPSWFNKLAAAYIVLIIIARMVFVVPIPFVQNFKIVRKQNGSIEWARQVKEKAGDAYVIFDEGFQEPSKYDYYNTTLKGFSYNTRYYRKNQFDMWPIEDSLRNKTVYYTHQIRFDTAVQDSFQTPKGKYYGMWIDQVRMYQRVEIHDDAKLNDLQPDEVRQINLRIYNPYSEPIDFTNDGQKWKCYLEYGFLEKGRLNEVKSLGAEFNALQIDPKQEKSLSVNIKAPGKPGKYKLIFSIRTDPFPGARNSRMIQVEVKDPLNK